MRNVLDTTPAYVVRTVAGNAAGDDFGANVTTVTAGQVAQHVLHLEPDVRAAQRIAQGRHEATVTAELSYAERAAALPVIVTVLWILGADVAAAVNAMIAAGGREIGGRWYAAYTEVTSNCLGTIGDHGQRHDRCRGWIAGGRLCRCVCHDGAEVMSYYLDRAIAEDLYAASEYRKALGVPALTSCIERRAGLWAKARQGLLAQGGKAGQHRVEPLPAGVLALLAEAAPAS